MIVASVMCDLSHMPTPFHLFGFYVMLAAPSVMRRFESFGIYVPASFSDGFLTRKHILHFLSILVFLRLSTGASLSRAFGSFLFFSFFFMQILLLISSKRPHFSVFSVFSTTLFASSDEC